MQSPSMGSLHSGAAVGKVGMHCHCVWRVKFATEGRAGVRVHNAGGALEAEGSCAGVCVRSGRRRDAEGFWLLVEG